MHHRSPNIFQPGRMVCFLTSYFLLLTSLSGCGVLTQQRSIFPEQPVAADGTHPTRDDIDAIVQDPDMTDEERRQALRDIGIEDEHLIDIFLDQ